MGRAKELVKGKVVDEMWAYLYSGFLQVGFHLLRVHEAGSLPHFG